MTRYLICCGDSTKLSTWSNIPYFLLQAGLREDLFQSGVSLQPSKLYLRKIFWNLATIIRHQRLGGFQYSQAFCNKLFKQSGLTSEIPISILSHFPFLPPQPWPPLWTIDFYIDATTKQIFDDYGCGSSFSLSYKNKILAREFSAYHMASSIICMSKWTANSVITDYDIPPDKVYIVPAGANIDEDCVKCFSSTAIPPAPTHNYPLIIGFLGKDWIRKGGPFLLDVVDTLRRRGIPSVVRAIGPKLSTLPAHPALQALGFIDKQTDTKRFINEIQGWHYGSLFSTSEAFGISNRECLRLGVPLIAHSVGGIQSTMPDSGVGMLFPPYPTSDQVADWICSFVKPYDRYVSLRRDLQSRSQEFTWAATIKSLSTILKSK